MNQAGDRRAAVAVKVGRRDQRRVIDSVEREAGRDRDSRVVVVVKVGRRVQDQAIDSAGRDRGNRVVVAVKVGRRVQVRAIDSRDRVVDRRLGAPEVRTREEVGANRSGQRVHADLAELFRREEEFS
jgi:hypothetical protein